jgi:ribonuclease G
MSETSQSNSGVSNDVSHKYDSELSSPPIQREVPAVSAAELKAGANERAQNRPLLQKIVAAFKKEKGSYRELIINSEPLEKRPLL